MFRYNPENQNLLNRLLYSCNSTVEGNKSMQINVFQAAEQANGVTGVRKLEGKTATKTNVYAFVSDKY